ncbi:MAG: hypothetical protein HQL49_13280, partial [Gammaproteobacteria bacterium]|nr:hypothetical protein [Gammaproteobacteria bacterium]
TKPDGTLSRHIGGDRLPQSAKEVPYRGHLFKLNFQPGDHDIFIRLQTTSTMAAIVKLWQPHAFEQHLRTTYFGFGLYFSLMLTVLLFNAANWLVSRRMIFFVYIGYLLLISLQWLGINGLTSEFLLPERPDLANLSLGLTISLVAAMAWLFFMIILELKRYHRFLYRFSQFGIAISLATFVATLVGYYQIFMAILLLVGTVSLLTVPWPMWRLWKTSEPWARLLAVAYLLYASLSLFNILGALAIIPFNEWSILAGMASNIVHILFLHFAILLHYRRIEQAHEKSLEKMQLEKNFRQEQTKLTRMLTHEIRTPIALIDSARQILEVLDADSGQPLNPERTRHYDTMKSGVNRLTTLLDLALAREKAHPEEWQIEKVKVDPEALTRSTLNLLDPSLVNLVTLVIAPALPFIHADSKMLQFALINLLDNASKYAPQQSPITVTLDQYNNDETPGVRWRVTDQGPGIPSGMEEQIFNKYTRLGESSGTAGLGLGLYLVRYIFEHHKGWIRVERADPAVTTFTGWLPSLKERP